jgi:hypothetical protein
MNALLWFVLWCLLFVLSWPVAILALVLAPFVWLLSLPLRLIGITVGAVFGLLRALLTLPARLIGGRGLSAAGHADLHTKDDGFRIPLSARLVAHCQASQRQECTMSKQVLILGSQGHFGAAAAAAFSQAGWRVLCHARRPDAALPAGARRVDTPLTDTDALGSASRWQCPGHPRRQRALSAMGARGACPWRSRPLPLAGRLGATLLLPGNVYNYSAADAFAPGRNSGAGSRTRPRGPSAWPSSSICRSGSQAGQRCIVLRAGDFLVGGARGWLGQAITKSMAKTASWSTPAAWTPPTPGRICRTWPSVAVALADRHRPAGLRALSLCRPYADGAAVAGRYRSRPHAAWAWAALRRSSAGPCLGA